MAHYSNNLVSRLLVEMDAIDMLQSRIRENGGLMSEKDDDIMNTMETNVMELRNALGKEAVNLAHDARITGQGAFQTVELFPPMPISGSPTSDCTECGGYVKMLQQHKHTAWHNKVADL